MMNIVAMKFHYYSSKSPHKQPPSLRCSTFFSSFGHHHPSSSLASSDTLTLSTGLQLLAALHSFNWSSRTHLLQLVSTASTASPDFACCNWSFRHWPFATRLECFKLHCNLTNIILKLTHKKTCIFFCITLITSKLASILIVTLIV